MIWPRRCAASRSESSTTSRGPSSRRAGRSPSSRRLLELDRERGARGFDGVVADGADQLGPVEQEALLLPRQTVLHVAVAQDLVERSPARVLADHVREHTLLRRRAREEEREGITDDRAEVEHGRAIVKGGSGCRGPLEIGVRNRVAWRFVRRTAQRAADSRIQPLGNGLLESVGLVVAVVAREPEGLRQVEL